MDNRDSVAGAFGSHIPLPPPSPPSLGCLNGFRYRAGDSPETPNLTFRFQRLISLTRFHFPRIRAWYFVLIIRIYISKLIEGGGGNNSINAWIVNRNLASTYIWFSSEAREILKIYYSYPSVFNNYILDVAIIIIIISPFEKYRTA